MLRARLAELEGQPSKAAQATVKKVSFALKEPQDEESGGSAKEVGGPSGYESVSPEGEQVKVARKVTLPPLPWFSGEKLEDGAFERWTKKLLRHAELEKWTEREKLLQLELHLSGQAEQLYEVLPAEDKAVFSKAVEALGPRLQPVKSEAFLSAQLLKRKQKAGETMDECSHEFEALLRRVMGEE